jgi:hypothetical protein
MKSIDRFTTKYKINLETGCWDWIAGTSAGYGAFAYERGKKAHRFSYEYHNNTILGELTIDHLCRNTLCVNPEHLEAVPKGENSRRRNLNHTYKKKEVCKNGHFIGKNEYVRPDGYSECLLCRSDRGKAYREKHGDEHRAKLRKYYHDKKNK